MSPFQTFTARLVYSASLSEVTKHFEFELPGEKRFGFVPGQWLSFKQVKPDGEELTRAYSIASPPGESSRFALCLNRVQDGFMSNFLCDMKVGDQIACQGPFGDFILHPPMRDTIFLATGTGVAPFRSMLRWLLADESRHQEKQLWLLFGNRYEADVYYHEEFIDLAAQHPNFHYLPTLSRGSAEWHGLRGYVQQHVPEIIQSRSGMHAYICGLDKMVKANRELLKSMGWDRKSIHYEKYD
ncbi:MAG TPA: FAD-dependent oxidoreductase [Candidatus Sulfotelmatobacter sp.]|jgi:ferredoxin-NADP reductase|nr:FAD-dependent oxidoreductase [Candidatus Sulfotelmatobacter sp.]